MGGAASGLRFRDFAAKAAAGVVAGALALEPMMASPAAAGSVPIHAGSATWFVNTDITGSTTSSGGLALSGASLHTAQGTRNVDFNGALTWHVNAGPPSSLYLGTYLSPGGTVSVTANSVVGTTQVLAGLNTHVELFFSSTRSVVRSLLVLQNPTGAPITATVDLDNNLIPQPGSTHYVASSSGGGSPVDPAVDNWAITCPQSAGACALTSAPVLTLAFSQTGAQVRAGAIKPLVDGDNQQYLRYTVTVPAGQTVDLMAFEQLSATPSDALTDAALFNSRTLGADYLTGLSPAQQARIANFNLGPPASVPTLSAWALPGLAGLLGAIGLCAAFGFGAAGGRRRRRWWSA